MTSELYRLVRDPHIHTMAIQLRAEIESGRTRLDRIESPTGRPRLMFAFVTRAVYIIRGGRTNTWLGPAKAVLHLLHQPAPRDDPR